MNNDTNNINSPSDRIDPKEVYVTFREHDHTYWDQFGNKYISGTTLKKKYVPEFESYKHSYNKAVKELGFGADGLEIEMRRQEIIREWELNRDTKAGLGTAYHKEKEDWVNSQAEYEGLPVILERQHISKLIDGLYTELTIWNYEHRIAGQADIVKLNRGLISIDDYKTCDEIKKSGYGKKMLYPIHNLDASKFNEFCIQLNIYAWMLKQALPGYEIGDLRIYHTKANAWHYCDYMQKEIELILENEKKQKGK